MRNTTGNWKPFHPQRQANIHEVIDLDDIIDYVVMNHDTVETDGCDDPKGDPIDGDNAYLAFMAGRDNDTSAGDIRHVLATKRAPDKKKVRKANETKSAPSSVTIGDKTYYLNKGETISFQGHHYTANMALISNRVSQHDVATMKRH